MPGLALPMRRITVTWGNRSRVIYIPSMGDPIWDKDIEDWQKEVTIAQLKKLPPLIQQTPETKKEVAGAIKEFLAWRDKRRKDE